MSKKERFERFILGVVRPRHPNLEAPLRAAVDAYDTIEQTDAVTPELLSPLLCAASSTYMVLWGNAVDLLAPLTGKYEEVREAVAELYRSSHAHVRFAAQCCLCQSTPTDFVRRLVSAGLMDKSSRVRWKAAQMASELGCREVLRELEIATERERNPRAKREMQFVLPLLRDGYLLKPADDGRFYLTVRTKGGGVVSRYVERSEIDTRGIKTLVIELVKEWSPPAT